MDANILPNSGAVRPPEFYMRQGLQGESKFEFWILRLKFAQNFFCSSHDTLVVARISLLHVVDTARPRPWRLHQCQILVTIWNNRACTSTCNSYGKQISTGVNIGDIKCSSHNPRLLDDCRFTDTSQQSTQWSGNKECEHKYESISLSFPIEPVSDWHTELLKCRKHA